MRQISPMKHVVVLLGTFILFSGCNDPDRDYENAFRSHTVEGYENALRKHPNHPRSKEAREKLVEAEWNKARETNTADAYRDFAVAHLESEFAEQAITSLLGMQTVSADEQHAFEAAAKRNMHFGYKLFIENYPDSPFSLLARRRLARFGVLVATKSLLRLTSAEDLIPIQQMKQKHQWDGTMRLWRWGDKLSGSEFSNGSILFLSENATTPENGVPFEFSSPAVTFGEVAVGNLQIVGRFHFDPDGIVLMEGTRMIYPLLEANSDNSTDESAETSHRSNHGAIALIMASYLGQNGVAQSLLSKGAEINLQDNNGSTALIVASQGGYDEIVQTLLVKGALVNIQDNIGGTALYNASLGGHLEIVQSLLSKGAEINLQNNNGFTALIVASQGGYDEIVQTLLVKGAEVNHRNNYGVTALYIAAQQGYERVVQTLLAKGADVDIQEEEGLTALIVASWKGHLGIVHLLLDKGAKIDQQSKNGVSALFIASSSGHDEIVRTLLGAGASVDLRANDGATALSKARSRQIEQLLREAGAKN